MRYSKSAVVEAELAQGGDAFVGIDRYRSIVLKAGTKLVKMEPSSSGYFTILDKIKTDNSQEISRGVQVAPREILFKNFYNEIVA